jgi:hypothetical protein
MERRAYGHGGQEQAGSPWSAEEVVPYQTRKAHELLKPQLQEKTRGKFEYLSWQ